MFISLFEKNAFIDLTITCLLTASVVSCCWEQKIKVVCLSHIDDRKAVEILVFVRVKTASGKRNFHSWCMEWVLITPRLAHLMLVISEASGINTRVWILDSVLTSSDPLDSSCLDICCIKKKTAVESLSKSCFQWHHLFGTTSHSLGCRDFFTQSDKLKPSGRSSVFDGGSTTA